MRLSEVKQGEKAIITKIKGRGAFRNRLIEMGLVVGKDIETIRKAPLRDPVEYRVMGYNVSLRNSEAHMIEVVSESEARELKNGDYNGIIDQELLKRTARKKEKGINVAFVGNPNCGKTTIFNYASGSREKVGNYGGVTVDAKKAKFKLDDYTINVVDLPGTYSITAYTPEELFVRDHILAQIPDIVVNVIDAGNLERNLYLTTQLIDMDIKVVVALNMYDELERSGDQLYYELLGKMLGIPFVPTVGSKGRGIRDLFQRIVQVHEDRDETVRHIHINYGNSIERSIKAIQEKVKIDENYELTDRISSRYLSIKLLQLDEDAIRRVQTCTNADEILDMAQLEKQRIEKAFTEDAETLITDAKYGFIAGALQETLAPNYKFRHRKSELVDSFITHRIWGLPIFIFFMWLTFYATFKIGQYPIDWIESLVEKVSVVLYTTMPQGIFKDLLIEGIIGGVGGVVVFLPNILLLYFFISIMEDTGYMARAVFIMDRAMHKIGLHGKSFIPLLMGFGCNVPAILSTRIIESRRDRLVTMLINPFMSCSARLPVYILLISAFFISYQGSILFLIYTIGVLVAILSAILFKKTMFKGEEVPFVMELPPYRVPTLRTLVKHMWHRAEQYLRKIGGVILVASIIIWALGYFPRNPELTKKYDKKIEQLEIQYSQSTNIQGNTYTSESNELNKDQQKRIHELKIEFESEQHNQSFIGQIGRFIEPAMKPLGFDWKMSVAILTGVAAKEIVVGTLGILYQADPEKTSNTSSLIEKLRTQAYTSGPRKGERVYNPLIAFSFMVFILLYFPCIAVIAAIKKESGSWGWAFFTVFYTTGVAWIMAFAVFQVGSLIT